MFDLPGVKCHVSSAVRAPAALIGAATLREREKRWNQAITSLIETFYRSVTVAAPMGGQNSLVSELQKQTPDI